MNGWSKSSLSGNGGCIEIHIGQVDVLVRDTKDPTGPFLVFTHDEWRAHVLAIRNGEHRIPGEEPDVATETWEDWLHAVRENERLRGLLESVSLYIPDEAPNVRAHVRAALAGQGDTPPAEPAPVQLDADAIERAAEAAARTHDHWACEWDEIPEYVRDDWRAVVRVVAAELGLPAEPVEEHECIAPDHVKAVWARQEWTCSCGNGYVWASSQPPLGGAQ